MPDCCAFLRRHRCMAISTVYWLLSAGKLVASANRALRPVPSQNRWFRPVQRTGSATAPIAGLP